MDSYNVGIFSFEQREMGMVFIQNNDNYLLAIGASQSDLAAVILEKYSTFDNSSVNSCLESISKLKIKEWSDEDAIALRG